MQPGDQIAGKYRIDRILGQGGMGIVIAATNILLGQRVALKFLLPELLKDEAVVERFLREARASARLRSEHVCRVYDVGIENGAPFIVMELLEGRDLESLVKANGALPVPTVVDYVLQATVGMAEAHGAGIVHRDLKPANLFLTMRPDGSPLIKILDFGIAKAPKDSQFQLTRTATVMGSPGYMSPEQLRSSRDADARSDIWALGVILFELLAGRPPFVAESITELTLRVAMDPTPPLPGVPPALAQVVGRCLEKDPARRFASVGELAEALAPFGPPQSVRIAARAASVPGVSSSNLAPMPIAVAAPTTLRSSAGERTTLVTQGPRLRWIVAGGVIMTGILVFAFIGTGGDDGPVTTGSGRGETLPAPADAEAPPPSQPATALPAPQAVNDAGVPTADASMISALPSSEPTKPSAKGTAQTAAPPPRPLAQPPATTPKPPAVPPRVPPAQPKPPKPPKDVGESRE